MGTGPGVVGSEGQALPETGSVCMRLGDHLREDRILVGVEAADRPTLLSHLGRALVASGVPADPLEMARLLAVREARSSTVLGHGIAVPHASLPLLEDPVLLVAVTADWVPFGAPEEDPVRIFFTLLTPPAQEGVHVRLLARICRVARHTHVLEGLMSASSPGQALDVLRSADGEEP